jgi:hypothetical protein
MMLAQICINNENNETRVEELSQERALHDRCHLLTNSILANPTDK